MEPDKEYESPKGKIYQEYFKEVCQAFISVFTTIHLETKKKSKTFFDKQKDKKTEENGPTRNNNDDQYLSDKNWKAHDDQYLSDKDWKAHDESFELFQFELSSRVADLVDKPNYNLVIFCVDSIIKTENICLSFCLYNSIRKGLFDETELDIFEQNFKSLEDNFNVLLLQVVYLLIKVIPNIKINHIEDGDDSLYIKRGNEEIKVPI
jgi:hypothetical protein